MRHHQNTIASLLSPLLGLPHEDVAKLIEVPQKNGQGDLALACFSFAKTLKQSPQIIAQNLVQNIQKNPLPPEIEKVQCESGYINFFVNASELAKSILPTLLSSDQPIGKKDPNNAKPIVIEFSSPNIAKPFSIGHLRSTNLGACLSRIYMHQGWSVERINHLGDWGTQFGKLITAYKLWGLDLDLSSEPIDKLFKLYVRFHKEEESNPDLLDQARQAFAKLEAGDQETHKLWTMFCDFTKKEFQQLYAQLGVTFDHLWGESFYMPHVPQLFEDLRSKHLVFQDQGAQIIDLKDHKLGVAVLQKGDESSLYITRDLAAARYRFDTFDFERMIYVVGSEQAHHFQQLFKILELMGAAFFDRCEYVNFGQISFGKEKMSTRKGNVVFLKDVLSRAQEEVLKVIQSKNPDLKGQEDIAKQVALGALLYADISARRIKNIKFDWDDILSFEGETGPYLQYSYVRMQSLIRKFDQGLSSELNMDELKEPEEIKLVKQLAWLEHALEKVIEHNEPFFLGKYLMETTQCFNKFYQKCRILDQAAPTAHMRMSLVCATAHVIKTGLDLLGIPTPERM